MRSRLVILFLFTARSLFAQKDGKIDNLPFCGWKMNSKKTIRQQFGGQFTFLAPQKGDTIVDIGAASGTYEGCLAAAFELSGVSFVLVDVDARCLNEEKLANVRRYYSTVKGDSISNAFQLVVNTQDSLFLPLNKYKKLWLLNTLHELPSPGKMALDIAAVLRPGGELCVLELLPHKEGQLHGGCNKPLLKSEEIKAVFFRAGFRYVEMEEFPGKKNFTPAMYRFVKE